MKKIKFIALAIIVVILSSFIFSCDNDSTPQNVPPADDTTPAAGEENGGDVEPPESVGFQIPEADFDGHVMRLLTISNEAWAIPELDVEELIGSPVNDAIFNRNRQIEAALNLTIQEIPGGWTPHEMLSRAVMAGADEYDIMFAHASSGAPLASQGFYFNLHDISTLNLDQPYWDQGAIRSFELMNKLYFTTSDACLMTNDAIWVLYFNKVLAQDMGLDNPYQLVREGRWTVDAMYNMMRQAVTDVDGSGIPGPDDIWGLASHGLAFMMFTTSFGELLINQDADGIPYLIEPNDRFINAYSRIRDLMNASTGMYLGAGALPGADFAHATTPFMNNRTLFLAEVLGWSRTFREMTADFGILPHPKLDENQPTHFNATANTVPIVAIPITNPNPERTGLFLDVLTALSETTVIPAYYTISLEGQFVRDEDSIEMLDIIRSNRIYDLGVIYSWGNFWGSFINHGMSPAGENPLTIFDRFRRVVDTQIERTIEAFESGN